MKPGPSNGPPLAVRARNLTRTFESGVGVHDLELDIERGTIFGFIGASGSGKTTTIRLMTGVLARESGELSVFGKDPFEFLPSERARLGYMPQLNVLYPELSLAQNLRFCAALFGMPWRGRRQRMQEVLDLVELTDARRRLLRESSGGMQRRLSLAATLIHDPDLLFLDEPTAGVDPVLRRKFWDHFSTLRDDGRTILVTTQYVGEAAYCDWVGVMAEGRLVAVDTPEGLRRQAFGGDVVDLTLAAPVGYAELDQMVQVSGATDSERLSLNQVRLVVDSAGDVTPLLSTWAADNGVEIESISEYLPPFDDVFVELINQLASASTEANNV